MNYSAERTGGRRARSTGTCVRTAVFLILSAVLLSAAGCGREEPPVMVMQEERTGESVSPAASAEERETKEAEASEDPSPEPSPGPDGDGSVCVYVTGAVRHPGVYTLPPDARVYEALSAAGGLTEEADPVWVNQAARLLDGMQLYIPTREETAASGRQWDTEKLLTLRGEDGETASSGQKVNINTADGPALTALPGIGEAKAGAIIAYREEHGAFRTIEEIRNVSGIKDSVFEKIKELITVD